MSCAEKWCLSFCQDGATTSTEDRLLVVGATNRPQEIDEAARRRLVKRLYIPLPEGPARKQIVLNLLSQQHYSLSEEEVEAICNATNGKICMGLVNICARGVGQEIYFIT